MDVLLAKRLVQRDVKLPLYYVHSTCLDCRGSRPYVRFLENIDSSISVRFAVLLLVGNKLPHESAIQNEWIVDTNGLLMDTSTELDHERSFEGVAFVLADGHDAVMRSRQVL